MAVVELLVAGLIMQRKPEAAASSGGILFAVRPTELLIDTESLIQQLGDILPGSSGAAAEKNGARRRPSCSGGPSGDNQSNGVPENQSSAGGGKRRTVSWFRLIGQRAHTIEQVAKRPLQGTLSPAARVTLTGKSAKRAGIPKGAHNFAFAYPLPLSESETEALIATAMRAAGREEHRRSKSRRATPSRERRRTMITPDWRKNTDAVAEVGSFSRPRESSTSATSPAWLDFVLTGGFVYFRKDGRFIQANAISHEAVDAARKISDSDIFAEGPHPAASEVGQSMTSCGRMEPVTLPALREAGFRTFGWVNPAETFEGLAPLGCDYGLSATKTHPAGAYIYGSEDGSFYFYALRMSPAQQAEAREQRQSVRTNGGGLVLDTALNKGVAKLRESVQRAHGVVAELLKEEERIRAMAEHVALSEAERRQARDPRRRRRMVARSRLMLFMPTLFSVSIASALLTAAYFAGLAVRFPVYRILASLVWFSTFTALVWRVFADCAIEGLSEKQIARRRRLLPAVPLLATAVEAGLLMPSWFGLEALTSVTASVAHKEVAAADFADVGALATAYILLFLVLPATIYAPRRRAALAAVKAIEEEHAGVMAGRAARTMLKLEELNDHSNAPTIAGASLAGPLARSILRGDARRRRRAQRRRSSAAIAHEDSESDFDSWDVSRSSIAAGVDEHAQTRGPVVMAIVPPPFMGPPNLGPIGAAMPPPPVLPDPPSLAATIDAFRSRGGKITPPASMMPPAAPPKERLGLAGHASSVEVSSIPAALPFPRATPIPTPKVGGALASLAPAANESPAVARRAAPLRPSTARAGTPVRLQRSIRFASTTPQLPLRTPSGGAPLIEELSRRTSSSGEMETADSSEVAEHRKAVATNLRAGLAAGGGEAWRGAVAAALRIQTRVRQGNAQMQFRRLVLRRHRDRCALSIPILIATAIELIGSLAIDSLAQWNLLDDWLLFSGWLILLLPSLGVMIRDLRRSALEQQPITFSISHAIYFAACLYRVSYRAAAFSIGCQSLLNRHFESDPTLAALLAQLAHQLCFTSIHALAKLTLQLVGIQNAFAHLLFPFHFFDVASNYAFFAIRDTFRDGFTTAWGASVALLQVNIILRNSGTWDGLVAILLRRLDLLEKSQTGPSDVLFGLQFFARLAIQFDLADLTAMVAVPSLVSFFVWRDGWFVLHGTGVEVRSCDLLNVWLHFLVLMVIKPVSFWIARRILERKMALTLLGRSTVHGKSSIAKERTGQLFHRLLHQATMRNISVSSRSMLSLNSTSKLLGGAKSMLASTKNLLAYGNPRGPAGAITPSPGTPEPTNKLSRVSSKVQLKDKAVLDAAFDQFGFSEERKDVIAKDFAVSHLAYAHLFYKILRRSHRFFAIAVLFQLFACLPRHSLRRQEILAVGSSPYARDVALPFRAAWIHLNSSEVEPEAYYGGLNDTYSCSIGVGWDAAFRKVVSRASQEATAKCTYEVDSAHGAIISDMSGELKYIAVRTAVFQMPWGGLSGQHTIVIPPKEGDLCLLDGPSWDGKVVLGESFYGPGCSYEQRALAAQRRNAAGILFKGSGEHSPFDWDGSPQQGLANGSVVLALQYDCILAATQAAGGQANIDISPTRTPLSETWYQILGWALFAAIALPLLASVVTGLRQQLSFYHFGMEVATRAIVSMEIVSQSLFLVRMLNGPGYDLGWQSLVPHFVSSLSFSSFQGLHLLALLLVSNQLRRTKLQIGQLIVDDGDDDDDAAADICCGCASRVHGVIAIFVSGPER